MDLPLTYNHTAQYVEAHGLQHLLVSPHSLHVQQLDLAFPSMAQD